LADGIAGGKQTIYTAGLRHNPYLTGKTTLSKSVIAVWKNSAVADFLPRADLTTAEGFCREGPGPDIADFL
jgi:hypothetical protein